MKQVSPTEKVDKVREFNMSKFTNILILIVFLIMGYPASPVKAADLRPIKVGLAVDQQAITLDVADIEAILDLTGSKAVNIPVPADQVVFTASNDTLELDYIPIGTGPFLIVPGANPLIWNNHRYRGGFLISARNSLISLIDFVSMDDYLRGVIPREVMASWPSAALKAQAIAARTYTIASLGRHDKNKFDLCPTDHCQVYGGIDAEKASTDIAVESTAGK
ncbi:MAG TPA: SpoIID/LytB domain-containing protein, partial [Bacillota bacterium]|nr:SpoIID/LytB domain-containing protein [Bacillota bacterium]